MTNAEARQMMATRGGLMSSMGTQRAQGVALGTQLNVRDRPVTMQGMRGLQTAGPSRQVQDSSYYVGILQGKVNELTDEVGKLQSFIETHEREMAQVGGLQRKHEKLLAQVRNLEGTLADYNLAMDKARGGTDAAELLEFVADFKARNKQTAEEVDRVFVVKKQKDDETRQIEAQISSLHEQAQRKLNDLEPAKLQLYNKLLLDSQDLVQRQDAAHQEIDALNNRIQDLGGDDDDQPRRKTHAEEYNRLLARWHRCERDEKNVKEEVEIWEHDDILDQLKSRVETQSKHLKECDGNYKVLKEQIAQLKKQTKDLDDDLHDRNKNDTSEKDKYEKLKQRDDEMTSFIRDFDDEKAKTLEETKATQETIVALLEHISLGLERETTMPTQNEYESMKEEATFKERQYESAKETTVRLLKEKEQREAELIKIDNLDEKIHIELDSLHQRMDAMRQDMLSFDDLDGLRRQANTTMSGLSRLLKDYQHRKDTVKAQVTQKASSYEALKAKLSNSDTHKSLTALEAKLRTYAQTIFHLQ